MSLAKRLMTGAGAAVMTSVLATGALAQSTGTTLVEELVVTASRSQDIAGMVAVDAPKSRASLNQDYIEMQVPGQTVLELLNQLPGVNFTSNDAYGSSGGDITMRGFDAQRIALLQDGIPLNDTGNSQIYASQQMDSELIDLVTVNLGATDVDSPTAAAAGGTINYTTRKPAKDFGGFIQASAGSDSYRRLFGLLDTGERGPWGTRAWLSASYVNYNLFNAPGEIDKKQINGRIWQDIGDRGDFVSVIANYNLGRNNFIRRTTLAQFNANAVPVYETSCALPSYTAPGPGAQVDQNCSNFFGNNINPSNTGNIRAQSSFHLSDRIRLTADPYFQYTIANGGGRNLFRETDPQLAVGGVAGTDLNRDGDLLDSVLLYTPNITNTRRYGVTSSLIWEINGTSNLRLAYTYDRGRHRQTGQAGYFKAFGAPEDVFGGKDGYGRPVVLPDGSLLRRRDRNSVAELNQLAVEYRGRFFEERLLVNAGLSAKWFHRELNNFCHQRDTFNAYCTTQAPSAPNAQGLVTFPVSALAPAGSVFGLPRSMVRDYDKVVPNLGLSWEIAPAHSLWTSYAETISTPRTEDLYDQKPVNPQPETTKTVDLGYRLKLPNATAQIAVFKTQFDNRVSRTYDEAAQLFSSINVGRVDYAGADALVNWRPTRSLSLRATVSYIQTEIKRDLPNGLVGGVPVFLATAGKSVPEIPELQGSIGANYEIGPFSFDIQGKFVDERWTNEVNTEKAPAYQVWDAGIRYRLDGLGAEGSYLQLNVKNLFDEKYLADITTNPTGAAQFQPGYPRAVTLTLRGAF